MAIIIGLIAVWGGIFLFCPGLRILLLVGTGIVIGLLIFWALVCYGFQMLRLFFHF